MAYVPLNYNGAHFERDCLTSKTARANPHIVARFDSPLAFLQYVTTGDTDEKASLLRAWSKEHAGSDSFYGTSNLRDVMAKLATGAPELADRVKALSRKVSAPVESVKKRTVRHVMGGRVCVPDLLSGSPTPMRRRVAVADPLAPLTIVLNLVSSGGIDADDMLIRGLATCALAQHLATKRQVTLYALASGQPYNSPVTPLCLIKLRSTPLDLTRAAYVLSNQGIARAAGFAAYTALQSDYARTTGKHARRRDTVGGVAWPFDQASYAAETDDNSDKGAVAPLARDLAEYLKTEILYIPGAFLGSKEMKACLADPARWVSDMVAKYSKATLAA